MIVKCPNCGDKTQWEGNKFRPFCSKRCKILDLGSWASEDYKVSESFSNQYRRIYPSNEDSD